MIGARRRAGGKGLRRRIGAFGRLGRSSSLGRRRVLPPFLLSPLRWVLLFGFVVERWRPRWRKVVGGKGRWDRRESRTGRDLGIASSRCRGRDGLSRLFRAVGWKVEESEHGVEEG